MMYLSIWTVLYLLGVSDAIASALLAGAALVGATFVTGYFATRTTRMISKIDKTKAEAAEVRALQSDVAVQYEQNRLLQDKCDTIQRRLDESLMREGSMAVDLDIATRQIATLRASVSALRKELAGENGTHG